MPAYASYGVSHIQLTVADLARSIAFYQGLFGMEVLFRHGEHAAMLRTPGTGEVFTLNADPEGAAQRGQMGGIAHFGFRLRENVDMAELLREVERLGGAPQGQGVRGSQREPWGYFTDPDGYEVEVFWVPAAPIAP